jgi:hypothetical protein
MYLGRHLERKKGTSRKRSEWEKAIEEVLLELEDQL